MRSAGDARGTRRCAAASRGHSIAPLHAAAQAAVCASMRPSVVRAAEAARDAVRPALALLAPRAAPRTPRRLNQARAAPARAATGLPAQPASKSSRRRSSTRGAASGALRFARSEAQHAAARVRTHPVVPARPAAASGTCHACASMLHAAHVCRRGSDGCADPGGRKHARARSQLSCLLAPAAPQASRTRV